MAIANSPAIETPDQVAPGTLDILAEQNRRDLRDMAHPDRTDQRKGSQGARA